MAMATNLPCVKCYPCFLHEKLGVCINTLEAVGHTMLHFWGVKSPLMDKTILLLAKCTFLRVEL